MSEGPSLHLGQAFLGALTAQGYDFFAGVPCSLFKGVLGALDADPSYGYLSAVREDAALGAAAGAWMGGRQPVVFMQNSGLGVSINALVSLHQIYAIPTLLVVSWRGFEGKDAPEHIIMGDILLEQLALLRIPTEVLDPARMDTQLAALTATMQQTRKPVALVVHKGVLD